MAANENGSYAGKFAFAREGASVVVSDISDGHAMVVDGGQTV
jgi:hypothetical protein